MSPRSSSKRPVSEGCGADREGDASTDAPLRLVLPWAVLESVNQRTNPAGWGKMKGRQFLTQAYRIKLSSARALAARAVPDPRPRFAGRVAVVLRFYQPDARRRDCGNFVKLVEDALTGYAYADDSQIGRQTWEDCGVDRERPRVEIELTPLLVGDVAA